LLIIYKDFSLFTNLNIIRLFLPACLFSIVRYVNFLKVLDKFINYSQMRVSFLFDNRFRHLLELTIHDQKVLVEVQGITSFYPIQTIHLAI
jgi:hypothetical protein